VWSGRIIVWCCSPVKGVFLVLAFQPVGGERGAKLGLGRGSRQWAKGIWVVRAGGEASILSIRGVFDGGA
jgi:hypothetical protein